MAHNDNAMTRFLFAILQQKCLKDIDWNKVAQDPNLAQPITNGHAARMRWSRFRSAMLGIEPQKRSRVTKPTGKKKKTTAASTSKKEAGDGDTENTPANSDHPPAKKIKLEILSPAPTNPQLPTPKTAAIPAGGFEPDEVKIKKERTASSTPLTTTMSMPGTPIDTPLFSNMMHPHRQSPTPIPQPAHNHTMRLLTPCSDHQSPVSVQAQAPDVLMHHSLNQNFMTATHNSPMNNNHDFHQHHHRSEAPSPYNHHPHHFDTASSPWGHTSHIGSQNSPASVSMYSPTTTSPAFGFSPSSSATAAAAATNCDHAHSHSQHTQFSQQQQQQTQDEHNLGLMEMGMSINTMNMNLAGMNTGQFDFNNMVMHQGTRTSTSPSPVHPIIKGEHASSSGGPQWGTMDAGFV
ncbi:hypothetical protein QBC41DRAFT_318731 [Cercophora samala]|uniref:Myb-like DNA-binding domain-containing protein n=1 Tax=Cercophora samala TaxID=330535 RepID=A0AA39ZG77_9PEZI|nr:hypothetical protein QBC41DRAFT_318731 [Cercophora samala]